MKASAEQPGRRVRQDWRALITPLLAAGLWWASPSHAADSVRRQMAVMSELQPAYPEDCAGARPGRTGLCLLVAVTPQPSGKFRVRPVEGSVPGHPAKDRPLPRNKVLSLPAGEYEIFKATGIDSQNTAKVSVREGRISTVQTMTLRFNRSKNVTYKIQRFQAAVGTNNGGCLAEFANSGAHAYLPGNFLINLANGGEQINPRCEVGGTTFNAVSGQGYTVKRGRVAEQVLAEADTYVHPNRVSALTSMAPANHGIAQIGWLSEWRLHRGIPNPDRKPHAALAFYGPGNYTYIVPFNVRRDRKACGVSLAQGLLPKATLLSGCTFENGRLTGFTVNKGNYFTYHNLYGAPGIAANAIRNTFTVENVDFKLP